MQGGCCSRSGERTWQPTATSATLQTNPRPHQIVLTMPLGRPLMPRSGLASDHVAPCPKAK